MCLHHSWPSAQVAVMGAQGAVEIIFRGKDVTERTTEYTKKFANPMVRGSAADARHLTQAGGMPIHMPAALECHFFCVYYLKPKALNLMMVSLVFVVVTACRRAWLCRRYHLAEHHPGTAV